MNQSWSMIACGHGTAERRPPGLCCDMAGQSGRIPFVCVCSHMCVCTCQSVSGSELPCQRVCSCMWPCLCVSAGMPPLSKQGSACHMVSCVPCGCHGSRLPWGEMQGEGRVQGEVEDCEVGLSGIPQWCQYGKNIMDSTGIFHEPLLFQPLCRPFRSVKDTKIWMNIKAGRYTYSRKLIEKLGFQCS